MRAGIVLTLTTFASTAGAREVDVAAGVTQIYASSASLDAVATWDAITLGAVEASMAVAELELIDRLHVELGYLGGQTTANDFEQFDATLELHAVHAGARAMHILSPRWRAFARADVGMTFASIELAYPTGTATPIRDDARGLSSFAGAGLEVTLARWPYFDVAVRAEGGYFAATAISFQATPGYPDDDVARLPVAAANLGSIDTSGMAWRFGVVGRF